MEFGWAREYYENFKNLEVSTFKVVSLFVLLLAALILRNHFKAILVISILYAADIVFDVFLKFTLRPIYQAFPLGIELVTFNTVIAGIALGPFAGVFCGLLFGATYYGIIFNFNSRYQLINIPAYGLIGYLAGALSHASIISLGMTLTSLYGVLTSLLIIIAFGGKLYKSLIFLSTNLVFNYWLFSNAGAIVLNIIG